MTENCQNGSSLGENTASLPVSECGDVIYKQTPSDVNIESKQNHVLLNDSPCHSWENSLKNNVDLSPANRRVESAGTTASDAVPVSQVGKMTANLNGFPDKNDHSVPNKDGIDISETCVQSENATDIPFRSFISDPSTSKSNIFGEINAVNDDSQLSSSSSKFVSNHEYPDGGSRDSFTQSDVEPSDLRKELLAALTRQQTSTPDSDTHSFATTASFDETCGDKIGEACKSEDSSDDEEESLSYELKIGLRILKEFLVEANKSLTWPFLNAVDPERDGVEDYYEKVPNPMWFNRMKEKFVKKEYSSITEFVSDCRLMLENCYRYNGPDHPISKKAQRLETMLEQKLSLLSRDLREKSSIAATTGLSLEERKITGTRRRKVLVPHDSTALLNQLRLEQLEREKETRRLQMHERKQQHEAALREVDDWEDQLLQSESGLIMRHCWEIPQIGHFLFLCMGALNIGEVMHFEIERCFAMPRESLTMQKVMTTLLSTPYQRTRLNRKPLMPYKVWEEKLRVRLRHWYKVLRDCSLDLTKTCNKLGIEEKFFRVVGLRSPMERHKYHELSFYQRVWIMKSLCDWCLENQESLREAIEAQPETEQRSYLLGTDAKGNSYINFPQFCGADVRIYRHAAIEMPTLEIPPQPKLSSSRRKTPSNKRLSLSKKALTLARQIKQKADSLTTEEKPREPRDSRLRKHPRQLQTYADVDSTADESNVTGEEETEDGDEDNNSDMAKETGESSEEVDSGISESETEEPPVKKSTRSTRMSARQQPSRKSQKKEEAPSPRRSYSASPACDTPVTGRITRSAWKKCIEETTPTNSRASTPASCGSIRKSSAQSRNSTPVPVELDKALDRTPRTGGRSKSRRKPGRRRGGQTAKKEAEDISLVTSTEREAMEVTGETRATSVDVKSDKITSDSCDRVMDSRSDNGGSEGNTADIGGKFRSDSAQGNMISCDEGEEHESSTLIGGSKEHSEAINREDFQAGKTLVDPSVVSGKRSLVDCSNALDSPAMSDGVDLNPDESSCDTLVRSHSPAVVHDSAHTHVSQSVQKSTRRSGQDTCHIQTVQSGASLGRCHDDDSVAATSPVIFSPNPSDESVEDPGHKTADMSGLDLLLAAAEKHMDGPAASGNQSSLIGNQTNPLGQLAQKDGALIQTEPKDGDVSGGPRELTARCVNDGMDTAVSSASEETSRDSLPETEAKPDTVKLEGGTDVTGETNMDVKAETDVKAEMTESVESSNTEVKMEVEESSGICPEEITSSGKKEDGSLNVKDEALPGAADIKTEAREAMEVKDELEEELDVEPEILEPDLKEFKLVVDSVDSLRKLAEEFEELPHTVVGSGKRERAIPATPRKKCEKDLLSRLLFLIKELEPWEHKLMSAHRRAKLRMKKEKENYVEEPETEQLNFWVSEAELSSDEDEDKRSEVSSYEAYSSSQPQAPPTESRVATRSGGRRDRHKRPALDPKEEDSQDTYTEHTEEFGISSKGRIRKRRVIPNNVEDQSLQPKKVKSGRHDRPALLSKGGKSSSAGHSNSSASLGAVSKSAKLNLPHLTAGAGTGVGGGSGPRNSAGQTLLIRSATPGSQGSKQYVQISGNLALRNPAVLGQLLAGQTNTGQQILVQGNLGQDAQKLIQAIFAQRRQQLLQQQPAPKNTVFQPFQFKSGEVKTLQQQAGVTSGSGVPQQQPSLAAPVQVLTPQKNAAVKQQQTLVVPSHGQKKLEGTSVNPLQLQQLVTPALVNQSRQTGTVSPQKNSSNPLTQNLINTRLSSLHQANVVNRDRPNTVVTPAGISPQSASTVVTSTQSMLSASNVATSSVTSPPQKVARIMTSQGIRTIPLSQLPAPILAQLTKLQSQNVRLQLATSSISSISCSDTTQAAGIAQPSVAVRPHISTGVSRTLTTVIPQPSAAISPAVKPPQNDHAAGTLAMASTSITVPTPSSIHGTPSPIKVHNPRRQLTEGYVSTAEPTPKTLVEIQLPSAVGWTTTTSQSTSSTVNPSGNESAAKTTNKYAAGLTVKELLANSNRISPSLPNVVNSQPLEVQISGKTVLVTDAETESLTDVTQSSPNVAESPAGPSQEVTASPTKAGAEASKVVLKNGPKIAVLKKTPYGTKQVMMDASNLQLLIAKKQAIDQAVKQVVTEAPTSLPTANIKVSSPFPMPTGQPHRPCTIATPSMKHPIPSVCPQLLVDGTAQGTGTSSSNSGGAKNGSDTSVVIASGSTISLSKNSLVLSPKLPGSSETSVRLVSSNSLDSILSSATLSVDQLPSKEVVSSVHSQGTTTVAHRLTTTTPQPKVAALAQSPTKLVAGGNTPRLILQQQAIQQSSSSSSQVAGGLLQSHPRPSAVMLQRQVINTPQGLVQGVILPQGLVSPMAGSGGGLIHKTKDGLVLVQHKPQQQASTHQMSGIVAQAVKSSSATGVVVAQGLSHLHAQTAAGGKVLTSEGNKSQAIAVMSVATVMPATSSVQSHDGTSSQLNPILVDSRQQSVMDVSQPMKAIQPKQIQFQITPQQQQLLLQQQKASTADFSSVQQQRTNLQQTQSGLILQQQQPPRMMLMNINGQLMAQPIGGAAGQVKLTQNLSLGGVQLTQLNQASGNPGVTLVGGGATPMVQVSTHPAGQSMVTVGLPIASNPGLAMMSGSQILGSNVQFAQVSPQQLALVGGSHPTLVQQQHGTPLVLTPQLAQQFVQQGVLQTAGATQFQIQTPQGPMAVIGGGGQSVGAVTGQSQIQTQQLATVQQLQQATVFQQSAFPQQQTQQVMGHTALQSGTSQQQQQQQTLALVQQHLVQGHHLQTQQQAVLGTVASSAAVKQQQPLVNGNPTVIQLQQPPVTSSQ